jgi:hypothetical protein
MKSRMEKYHGKDNTPQRTEKNTYLYDEMYSKKQEPTSNVTVFDNVDEIDINKIKTMINNREEYKSTRKYTNLIGREERHYSKDVEFRFDEPEPKDYDINEIIKRKRDNKGDYTESEKIRKISNTQYDILKGLSLEEKDASSNFVSEKELTDISEKEAKMETDFFKDLKKSEEENLINEKDIKEETSFYSSKLEFEKDDFEELEDLKNEVKKHNVIMKVLLIVIVCIVVGAIIFLAINYIDFSSLLK